MVELNPLTELKIAELKRIMRELTDLGERILADVVSQRTTNYELIELMRKKEQSRG